MQQLTKKQFNCYFHWLGLWSWQIGIHAWLPGPNIEVHVPFGFLKIGFTYAYSANHIRTVSYTDNRWQFKRYGGDIE